MNYLTIALYNLLGAKLLFPEEAQKVKTIIKAAFYYQKPIILDFSNIEVTTPEFLEEMFLEIQEKYSAKYISDMLIFVNTTNQILHQLGEVFQHSFLYFNDPVYKERIDRLEEEFLPGLSA